MVFTSDLKECNLSHVTFEDGVKGIVFRKGHIIQTRLPLLHDIRLVESLFVNLIRVSQLCDQGYQLSFSKNKCLVKWTRHGWGMAKMFEAYQFALNLEGYF